MDEERRMMDNFPIRYIGKSKKPEIIRLLTVIHFGY
jgi:hypothetical protein